MAKKAVSYTKKSTIPQYIPKRKDRITLDECVEVDKYVSILEDINAEAAKGTITEEQTKFFKLSATRWLKFNYENIAEYYAQNKSNPAVQRIMERLVLILLDPDDALAQNVVAIADLKDRLAKQYFAARPERLEQNDNEARETPSLDFLMENS